MSITSIMVLIARQKRTVKVRISSSWFNSSVVYTFQVCSDQSCACSKIQSKNEVKEIITEAEFPFKMIINYRGKSKNYLIKAGLQTIQL